MSDKGEDCDIKVMLMDNRIHYPYVKVTNKTTTDSAYRIYPGHLLQQAALEQAVKFAPNDVSYEHTPGVYSVDLKCELRITSNQLILRMEHGSETYIDDLVFRARIKSDAQVHVYYITFNDTQHLQPIDLRRLYTHIAFIAYACTRLHGVYANEMGDDARTVMTQFIDHYLIHAIGYERDTLQYNAIIDTVFGTTTMYAYIAFTPATKLHLLQDLRSYHYGSTIFMFTTYKVFCARVLADYSYMLDTII